jgi:purine-binding chemotaxis protein CheW
VAKEEVLSGNREEQYVAFHLAGQIYGVNIEVVYEINRITTITRVPRTPEFVEGVINLRGKIIPVIDLCKRFNLPQSEITEANMTIIVELGGNTIGMIVDGVSEVVRVPLDNIDPPPPMVHGIEADYLKGISIMDEKLMILLNMEKVLYGNDEKGQFPAVAETA